MILFNVEALLDMCLTPPVVIRDGKLVKEKPLLVSEKLIIPGYGEMEAFITDGLFSLCKTLVDKGVKRACEYTLRHPGFCKSLQVFKDAGFFSIEPIEVDDVKVRPLDVSEAVLSKLLVKKQEIPDITYLYTVGKGKKDGKKKKKSYELIARSDDAAGITSMEIATAYPASIAAIIAAYDDGGQRGIVEPECFFIDDKFRQMVAELAKRNIFVYEK
jgi:saccharopine dehydrogenase-like NADP-dependent oxidoreductase